MSGDAEAAYCAISMGAGQIMGFNAQKFGYDSAQDMFEKFNSDASENIGGVFTFIENNATAREHLASGNFTEFARIYNGNGDWVDEYGRLIGEGVRIFESLEDRFLSGDGGAA